MGADTLTLCASFFTELLVRSNERSNLQTKPHRGSLLYHCNMGKKWLPLESNPDVLNDFARKLGLETSRHSFHDVYGMDPVSPYCLDVTLP